MKPALILTSLLIVLTSLSCKHSTEPEKIFEPEPQPGRRDYVWTEYVLESSYNYLVLLNSMWGATSNDIWACGQAYLAKEQVWHFDGNTWTESGHLIPGRDQTSVWGSSANDIWMSNETGKMFHYDGKEWIQATQLKVDMSEYLCLINSIWGISSNEIFATGFCFQPYPSSKEQDYYGVVFNYNGKAWKQIQLPKISTSFISVVKDKDGIIYIASFNIDEWLGEIFSFDGISFNKLMKFDGLSFIKIIDGYAYTQKNQKIYKLTKNGSIEWKDLTGSVLNGELLGGRNIKDFFAISKNGIGHYNGTDFVQLYPLNFRANVTSSLIFEKEVFFLVADNNINKTRVIYGKLYD